MGYLLFFALWVASPLQAIAVQATSVVLLDVSSGWQPARSDLNWSTEDGDRNRGMWTLAGGAIGLATGLIISDVYPVLGTTRFGYAIGGAVMGTAIGFILGGPSPQDQNELRLAAVIRPYIPAQGGIGLALDF